MGLEVWGINNDVIWINEQRLSDLATLALLHYFLELCWGVAETKGHALEFKQAQWSGEGSFLSVHWVHLHLPVTAGEIQGGKPLRLGPS